MKKCKLVGILLVLMFLFVGCVWTDAEVNKKIEDLAKKHAELVEKIKETYAKMADGSLDVETGLRMVREYSTEAEIVAAEHTKMQEDNGIKWYEFYGMLAVNILLVGFGGPKMLALKNSVLGMVNEIHNSRVKKKGVESLVKNIAKLDDKNINKAAAKMPPT